MHRWKGAAAAAAGLVGVFYLLTIREGHDWGDDFSLYVSHARNVVEGNAYGRTGYVYNPAFPSVSPRTYPPVWPLLLAPVYRCFGLDLVAMKAELTLLFVAFLVVFALGWGRDLPGPYRPAAVLLLGLNPFFWEFKDRLLSEVPFLLFTYLALALMSAACAEDVGRRRRVLLALAAGAATYLACGTRSVGVVLAPALVVQQLLSRRRSPLVAAVILLTFGAGVLAQRALLPFDGSYFDQLVFDPVLFGSNLLSLVKALGLFVDNGYSRAARLLLFGTVSALALLGCWTRVRERWTVAETFLPLYGLAVTVWPSAAWGQRFLVPVVPLFVFYGCLGIRRLSRSWGPRLEVRLGAVVAAAVLLSYAGRFSRLDLGPLREGIGKPETADLFTFVREQTGTDAVLLFQRPRALALFTGRRASAHHAPRSDDDLWHYLRRIGATHVVVARVFPESAGVLKPFVERNAAHFRRVYDNPDFTVYRVKDVSDAALASSHP
jgi:hypothetical protein